MLEKLGFQQLLEEHVTLNRLTRSMPAVRFVLAMMLALYIGFSRLNHLSILQQEPMLTGILEVVKLPVQSTFWRFLASLHLVVARQLLEVGRRMRQWVWQAAHVELREVTLDTDTTVHTVYGRQMGARKSCNPKNKGKKSFQPILTFLAETRGYVAGELRSGDRPTGQQMVRHRVEDLRHTTLATARLRFLFLAAKIVHHAGPVIVRYSDHYPEQGTYGRLMDRLRAVAWTGERFAPVLAVPLRL
jgi:hypothetical protein